MNTIIQSLRGTKQSPLRTGDCFTPFADGALSLRAEFTERGSLLFAAEIASLRS